MTAFELKNTRRVHRRFNNNKRDGTPSAGVPPVSAPSVGGGAGGIPSSTGGQVQSKTPVSPPSQPPTPTKSNNPSPNQNQNTPANSNSNTPSSSSPLSTPSSAASTPTQLSVALPSTPTNAILNTRSGYTLPSGYGVNTFEPSFTVGTDAAASATTSPAPSAALSKGAIVGLAAGGLVGFGILVSIGLWIIRRYFQGRHHNEDDDDADYMRNSVHVEDEPNYYNQPRPPTMIERHFGATGAGAHGPVSFNPGEAAPTAVNPFLTPMGSPAIPQHDMSYEQQQRPIVTRNGSLGSQYSQEEIQAPPQQVDYNHQDNMMRPPQADYANLERSSVTPFQAQQYAEIHRRLGNDPNASAVANSGKEGGPPVLPDLARALSPVNMNGSAGPSPYNYPVPGHTSGGGQNFSMPSRSPKHPGAGAQNGMLVNVPEGHYGNESSVQYGYSNNNQLQPEREVHMDGRPYTVYEEEDAYGGI